MSDLEIANIVASGRLGVELDLAAVAVSEELNDDPRIKSIEHSQKSGQRVLVRFTGPGTLGILSRKGACIITGAKSFDEVETTKDDILNALYDAEVIPSAEVRNFGVQNIVFTASLDEPVDLNTLTVALGFEKVEYEPEQFPGLVFRPPDTSCVILIFGTGKIVITGGRNEEESRLAMEILQEEMSTFQS